MKVVKLAYGQTFYDIAVQEYGSTEGVFLILEDNPGVVFDLSDVPQPGTPLLIREVPELSSSNRAIAAEFARRGKLVVSGLAATAQQEVNGYVDSGYWNVGYAL